jgi:serine/threonine-protein kinase
VLPIAFQVCLGLRRAHEQGIIHRDIKAGNIYLARRDDGQIEVKILDFGIAKLRVDPLASIDGHDLTRSGSVLGSPLYMSPEQATGSRELDVRSDIWSLGVVMYEALTGATPHGNQDGNQALGAVILAICSQPAPPLRERASGVSPEVAAVVHKALALEPGQRFASVEEMQTAIQALLPGGTVIHEGMLATIPAGSGALAQSETPQAASEGSATPPAQTTVDAVTYGSGVGKASRPPTSRRATVPLAVAGGIVVLAAGIGIWRERGGMSESDAASSASSTPVAAAEKGAPAPQATQPPPPAKPAPVPPSEQVVVPPAPSAAPPVPRPAAQKPRSAPKAARPTVAGPTSTSAPPPSSAAAPAPAAPAAGSEPAIDRRFD